MFKTNLDQIISEIHSNKKDSNPVILSIPTLPGSLNTRKDLLGPNKHWLMRMLSLNYWQDFLPAFKSLRRCSSTNLTEQSIPWLQPYAGILRSLWLIQAVPQNQLPELRIQKVFLLEREEMENSTKNATSTNILVEAAQAEAPIDRTQLVANRIQMSIAGIVVEKAIHSRIALFGRKP